MANVVTSTDARSALVRRLKSGYCGGCSGDVYRKSGEPVEHSAHCEAAALLAADGERLAKYEAMEARAKFIKACADDGQVWARPDITPFDYILTGKEKSQ